MVEQLPVKELVAGSSPAPGAHFGNQINERKFRRSYHSLSCSDSRGECKKGWAAGRGLEYTLAKSRMAKKKSQIKPGGVAKYIATCPKEAQGALKSLRGAIRSVAPKAVETVSYFQYPGYNTCQFTY